MRVRVGPTHILRQGCQPRSHESSSEKRCQGPHIEPQYSPPGILCRGLVVHGKRLVKEGMSGVGIDAHLEVFFVGDHRFNQFIQMRVNAQILRSIVAKHRAGEVLDQFNRMWVLPIKDDARRQFGVTGQVDGHPPAKAKAWLLRIALNLVRMQQRRRSLMRFIPFSRLREAQREEDDTDLLADAMAPVQPAGYSTPDTGDPAEVVAEREAIKCTLAQLPEALRTPLLLSIVGGLSSSEIAALLDVGEAAVRQRLSRARQQFRRIYTAESGDTLVNDAATTVAPSRERRVSAQGVPLGMTA